MAYQPDPGITSLVSTVPSSVIVGASIFGALPDVTVTALQGASVSGTVQTEGTEATGAAQTANPVVIGGQDTYGSVAAIQTAPDGDIVVHQHASVVSFVDNVSNQLAIPVGENDSDFMVTPAFGYQLIVTGKLLCLRLVRSG